MGKPVQFVITVSAPPLLLISLVVTIELKMMINAHEIKQNYVVMANLDFRSTQQMKTLLETISWLYMYHLDSIKILVSEFLYQTNMLSWIFIVLGQWNNNSLVDMSLHSDTLFWYQANQSLLLLLNAAFLTDKQQIPNL